MFTIEINVKTINPFRFILNKKCILTYVDDFF